MRKTQNSSASASAFTTVHPRTLYLSQHSDSHISGKTVLPFRFSSESLLNPLRATVGESSLHISSVSGAQPFRDDDSLYSSLRATVGESSLHISSVSGAQPFRDDDSLYSSLRATVGESSLHISSVSGAQPFSDVHVAGHHDDSSGADS